MHQIFDTVLGDSIFASKFSVTRSRQVRPVAHGEYFFLADGRAWLASKDHLRPHV